MSHPSTTNRAATGRPLGPASPAGPPAPATPRRPSDTPPIPLATWIDDWGRWFLRTYFIGSICCLCTFTVSTLFVDFPGPYWFALLMAALLVPLAFVTVGLAQRLMALGRGELRPEPVDLCPAPGLRGWLSEMRWLLATVVMFGAWPGFYFVASKIGALQEPVELHFAIDDRLPMVTELSPVYVTIYWFFIFPALYGKGRKHFWPLFKAYGTIMATCTVVYVTYPVIFPRDPVVIRHLGDWALTIVHGADPPINCFPSSHCAVATLAALSLRDMHPPAFVPAALVAAGICVATVLTKQHYLVDTLAGILLGGGAYLASFRPELRRRLVQVFVRR